MQPQDEIDNILLKDPKNSEAWKKKGDLLFQKTKFYESSNCYSKAIFNDPNFEEAWREKGLVCLLQHDMPDAYDFIHRAIYLNEDDSEAWRLNSFLFPFNEQMVDSINESIKKALSLNPDGINILLSKGLHLRKQGKIPESLSCFEKILSIEPENIFALYNKEKIIQKEKIDHKEAPIRIKRLQDFTKSFLTERFENVLKDSNKLKQFGDSFFLQFDIESARSYYGLALQVTPNDPDILKKQGLVFIKFQDFQNGLNFLSKSLKINPDDTDGWTRMGQILRIQNKMSESISCFDKAIKLDDCNAEALRHKGYAMQLRHDMVEEALTCIENSLKLDPYNPLAYIQKSVYLMRDPAKFNESMWCLDKALEIHPTCELAWKQKSELFSNSHDYESAIESYENVLKLNPDDIISWYMAGITKAKYAELQFQKGLQFLKENQNEKAQTCFEKVIKFDPNDVESLIFLGDIYKKQNQPEMAKQFINKVKNLASKIDSLTNDQELLLEKNLVWIFGIKKIELYLDGNIFNNKINFLNQPKIGLHINSLSYQNGKPSNYLNDYQILGKKPYYDYFFFKGFQPTWEFYLRKLILHRIYTQFPDISKRVIIKDEDESIAAELISDLFPSSKIIVIVMEGNNYVQEKIIQETKLNPNLNSLKTSSNLRKDFMKNQSNLWHNISDILLKAYEKHDEQARLLLRYEDFEENPQKNLEVLFDFIDSGISKTDLQEFIKKVTKKGLLMKIWKSLRFLLMKK